MNARRFPSKLPREVFISHSSGDRKTADKLTALLTANGIQFWYSRRNIVGAQQWHDEIGAALERCDWFLLLLSPQSVKSEWVKRELLFALNHSRYKRRIIPCIVKKCDINKLSWTLSGFQFVDFQKSFELGMRSLLKIWSLDYQQPSEVPLKGQQRSGSGRAIKPPRKR